MSTYDLFAEAQRQLTVCNSCRYCEGYCPVWPTLETMPELTAGDITHLANLCHDCQDCYTACMYVAPHEFALNPPQVFSAVRAKTYRDYIWPRRPGWARGGTGIAALTLVVIVVVVDLAVLLRAGAVTGTGTAVSASPYRLLTYWALIGIVSAPVIWGFGVTAVAVARYWRDVHGSLRALLRPIPWLRAFTDAARLCYLEGGGAQCTYPTDEPAPWRRRYHSLMVGGLLLCLVSTVAAAVQQDFLGWQPPYPFWSVPPAAGTLGGLAIVAGCSGLLAAKRASVGDRTDPAMRRADILLLSSLLLLALTGLLTLALRSTMLFLPILAIHLVAVITCFCVALYSKFMHAVYRLLSIYKYWLDGI